MRVWGMRGRVGVPKAGPVLEHVEGVGVERPEGAFAGLVTAPRDL